MEQTRTGSTVVTGLVTSLLVLSACQSGNPREADSLTQLKSEQRHELFRACYIQTLKRHLDENLSVSRNQVHAACSKFARSRVPG